MFPARLIPLILCSFALVSCGKSPTESPEADPHASAADSADLSKQVLTEAKVKGFADSLNEQPEFLKDFARNPGMGALMPGWSQAKVAELNGFAKKYGFKDFTEYSQCMSRIMIAQSQIAMDDVRKSMQKALQEQESGAAPDQKDLPPEVKQMMEAHAKAQKDLLDNMNKNAPKVNAADLELIRKYWPAIEQGMKKADGTKE